MSSLRSNHRRSTRTRKTPSGRIGAGPREGTKDLPKNCHGVPSTATRFVLSENEMRRYSVSVLDRANEAIGA